jgi:predicted AAA+ superfamily ATPase
VCIDEFQHVPEILDAVKAALNERLEPGRFELTGSTRNEGIPRAAQSLTGRLHLLTVWPLSQGEVAGVEERFIATVLDDPTRLITNTASSTSRGARTLNRRELHQAPRTRLPHPPPPAWGRTLRARATTSPEVHVVDTGLGARLLGLTEAKLARKEPAAVTEFGHLLESFLRQ